MNTASVLDTKVDISKHSFGFFKWKGASEWRKIGLSLNVDRDTINNIENNNKKVETCFEELLKVVKGDITYRKLLSAMANSSLTKQLQARPHLLIELDEDPDRLKRLKTNLKLLDQLCENPALKFDAVSAGGATVATTQ